MSLAACRTAFRSSVQRSRWLDPDSPVARFCTANCLFAILAAVVLGTCQYQHYWHATYLSKMELSAVDQAILFWTVCAKTLLLLSPTLLVAAVCTYRGRPRTALVVTALSATVLLAWLKIEIDVQRQFGRSLSAFAPYLVAPRTWQLGGNLATHLTWVLPDMAWAVMAVAAALTTAHGGLRLACRRWSWPRKSACCGLAGATWLGLTFGVLAPQARLVDRSALAILQAASPVNVPLLNGSRSNTAFVEAAIERQFEDCFQRAEKTLRASLPLDDTEITPLPAPPNVLLIVIESVRHDAFSPDTMPRLAARLPHGFQLRHHYSGSNRTEMGMFGLLYGRSPIEYEATLAKGRVPQACHTLRRMGYTCSMISSHDRRHCGMERFVNENAFDQVDEFNQGWWYERDRQSLARARHQLGRPDGKPQFVMVFLISSHYPYRYPPEYNRHIPATAWSSGRRELLNRYRNALLFTDHEVDELLADIELEQNLVMITGDHGESFYDDGTLSHACRLSEITCRVPLLMLGHGITPGHTTSPTQHADMLPTILQHLSAHPVNLSGYYGRDVVSGIADRDQILVGQPMSHDNRQWEMLLIRPAGRLGFQIGAAPHASRLLGLYDENGIVDPRLRPTRDEFRQWRAAMERETFGRPQPLAGTVHGASADNEERAQK